MAASIALLRGVNVGGRNMLKMAELKAACESLGLEDVRTYLQSGNVVFRGKTTGDALARAIRERSGIDVRVVLRTAAELRKVVAANPFPGRESNKLNVTFLDAPLRDETRLRGVADEEVHIAGRDIYIYFPNGMGRSKLRILDDSATTRNWNTVNALAEMAASRAE